MVFYRLDQGCIVDALQCTGNVVFKAMDILNLKSVNLCGCVLRETVCGYKMRLAGAPENRLPKQNAPYNKLLLTQIS